MYIYAYIFNMYIHMYINIHTCVYILKRTYVYIQNFYLLHRWTLTVAISRHISRVIARRGDVRGTRKRYLRVCVCVCVCEYIDLDACCVYIYVFII